MKENSLHFFMAPIKLLLLFTKYLLVQVKWHQTLRLTLNEQIHDLNTTQKHN